MKEKEYSFRARLSPSDRKAIEALKSEGHIASASDMLRECIKEKAFRLLPFGHFAEIYPADAFDKLQKQNPTANKEELARTVEAVRQKYQLSLSVKAGPIRTKENNFLRFIE
jgi:hypothetical protein